MVGSCFLWAMKMCLWAGRICLDNDRPGHALEMFDHVLTRREQRRMNMKNGDESCKYWPDIAYIESTGLRKVFKICERLVDDIREKRALGLLDLRKGQAVEEKEDWEVLRPYLMSIPGQTFSGW